LLGPKRLLPPPNKEKLEGFMVLDFPKIDWNDGLSISINDFVLYLNYPFLFNYNLKL
jgi:hypothetical protein